MPSLFDTDEQDLAHAAAERAVEHVYGLLKGTPTPPLSYAQRQLLRELVNRRGCNNAIALGRLVQLTRLTPREIKAEVRDLRLIHRARIGSSRRAEGGYYIIQTKDEALDTARPFAQQAKSEWQLVEAILEPHELAELEGQMRMEVPGE